MDRIANRGSIPRRPWVHRRMNHELRAAPWRSLARGGEGCARADRRAMARAMAVSPTPVAVGDGRRKSPDRACDRQALRGGHVEQHHRREEHRDGRECSATSGCATGNLNTDSTSRRSAVVDRGRVVPLRAAFCGRTTRTQKEQGSVPPTQVPRSQSSRAHRDFRVVRTSNSRSGVVRSKKAVSPRSRRLSRHHLFLLP